MKNQGEIILHGIKLFKEENSIVVDRLKAKQLEIRPISADVDLLNVKEHKKEVIVIMHKLMVVVYIFIAYKYWLGCLQSSSHNIILTCTPLIVNNFIYNIINFPSKFLGYWPVI